MIPAGTTSGCPADPLSSLAWLGGELLGIATMIGDQDDLHVWRSKRDAWVERTAHAVEAHDASAVKAFREAARVKRPLAGWQLAMPTELDSLRAAVQFLRALERHRAGAPGAAPPTEAA
jgi:hypothetical protein